MGNQRKNKKGEGKREEEGCRETRLIKRGRGRLVGEKKGNELGGRRREREREKKEKIVCFIR